MIETVSRGEQYCIAVRLADNLEFLVRFRKLSSLPAVCPSGLPKLKTSVSNCTTSSRRTSSQQVAVHSGMIKAENYDHQYGR